MAMLAVSVADLDGDSYAEIIVGLVMMMKLKSLSGTSCNDEY